MTSTQVVETSVTVTSNSPSQHFAHLDDRNFTLLVKLCDMIPGLSSNHVRYCLDHLRRKRSVC